MAVHTSDKACMDTHTLALGTAFPLTCFGTGTAGTDTVTGGGAGRF